MKNVKDGHLRTWLLLETYEKWMNKGYRPSYTVRSQIQYMSNNSIDASGVDMDRTLSLLYVNRKNETHIEIVGKHNHCGEVVVVGSDIGFIKPPLKRRRDCYGG